MLASTAKLPPTASSGGNSASAQRHAQMSTTRDVPADTDLRCLLLRHR